MGSKCMVWRIQRINKLKRDTLLSTSNNQIPYQQNFFSGLKQNFFGWAVEAAQLVGCLLSLTESWVQSPALHKLGKAKHYDPSTQRVEGRKIKVILNSTASSKPAWDTWDCPKGGKKMKMEWRSKVICNDKTQTIWKERWSNSGEGMQV